MKYYRDNSSKFEEVYGLIIEIRLIPKGFFGYTFEKSFGQGLMRSIKNPEGH